VAIIRKIATRAARRTLSSQQYGLWGLWRSGPQQWAEKWWADVPRCVEEELGAYLTQCRLGLASLRLYQVVSW